MCHRELDIEKNPLRYVIFTIVSIAKKPLDVEGLGLQRKAIFSEAVYKGYGDV